MLGDNSKGALKLMSQVDVEKIHSGTLKILSDTGVMIKDKDTLEMLAENGCNVDIEKGIAKFTEKTVMDSLEKSPTSFELTARDPKNNCTISSGGPFILRSVAWS